MNMKSFALTLVLAAAFVAPGTAHAQLSQISVVQNYNLDLALLLFPKWKCKKWDGTSCTPADRSNPANRQIVFLSTGFSDDEQQAFWTDYDRMIGMMTNNVGNTWSAMKKDQILYIGYFVSGGALGTDTAAFKAKVSEHPIRGHALTLDQASVYTKIDQLRGEISDLKPMAVGVLFNSYADDVTANASPPSVVGKPYGVARWTRYDLDDRGGYIASHELAHAGLNFLDEYVEDGFQDINIRSLDVLTPLALLDNTWGGILSSIANLFQVFDMRLSDILSNNGSDNMATERIPGTVYTSGFARETYEYEGGMFFGRGTWHMRGNNLMNSGNVVRGPGDDFGFDHSPAQRAVVHEAFGATAHRPNDRLRNAGPNSGWPSAWGSTTKVMLFDGDKLHHFHPTRTYTVQVGWYEREWHTCWALFIPYPCSTDEWRVAEKTVWSGERRVTLTVTAAYGLASLLQKAACAAGINEISSNGGTFRLCDQSLSEITGAFIPTIVWRLPYQEVSVPASQWMTKYYWRFRTYNGAHTSGWTGWSTFVRTF